MGRQQKTVTFREWLSPFSDGQRVKAVEGSEMILFVGSHYEVKGSEITKYYLAGATRVAVRKYTVPASSELTYLLGDHLGSTSLATDETGALLVETRYKAWGEVRYTTEASTLPTRYTYTGQYSYVNDEATDLGSLGFGLMYYGARFYAPSTGRFSSADTIIPEQTQGTQAWDRYAYVNNSPITYTDPTGHWPIPNPFAHDTLSIGFKGLLKVVAGIDADITVNINLKALKEFNLDSFDASINIGSSASVGVSFEGAVGITVEGHDGSVLDQSGFELAGYNYEVPVNVGGCVEDICASALYTFDGDDPDGINGEGYFVGVGDPLGIDISVDVVGGSDWVYYTSKDKTAFQVPFLNENFLKTIPLIKNFME